MKSIAVLSLVVVAVKAQQGAWGQCGGSGWAGATLCVSGYVCTYSNDYYSQCIPGVVIPLSSTTSLPTTTPTPTKSTTFITSPSPSTSRTSTLSPTSTPSGTATGPGTTLQSGYLWIRAVEAPNFHKYLQSRPLYSPGVAVLDSYTSAGQFQIVSGQLVQLVGSGGFLYANVAKNTTAKQDKLSVSFETTKNSFGTFVFSGDAVTWSTPEISRPNLSAWLVCGNQTLWINLGNYAYMTPAGCVDETIHFYNDKTANS